MNEKLKASDIRLEQLIDAIDNNDGRIISFVARRQPLFTMFLATLTKEQRAILKGLSKFISLRKLETSAEEAYEVNEPVKEVTKEGKKEKKATKKVEEVIEEDNDDDDFGIEEDDDEVEVEVVEDDDDDFDFDDF